MKTRIIVLIALLGLLLSAAVIAQAVPQLTCADIDGEVLNGDAYYQWAPIDLEAGTVVGVKDGKSATNDFKMKVSNMNVPMIEYLKTTTGGDLLFTIKVTASGYNIGFTENNGEAFTAGTVICTPPKKSGGAAATDKADEPTKPKATEEPVVTRPGIDTGDAPGLIVPVDPKGNEDKSNPVKVAVYGIDGDNGYLAFAVTVAELTAHKNWPADKPYRSSEDGLINLYILGNNECQVNFGPDAEGKVQEVVFTCDTAELIRRSEFNVNDLGGD